MVERSAHTDCKENPCGFICIFNIIVSYEQLTEYGKENV